MTSNYGFFKRKKGNVQEIMFVVAIAFLFMTTVFFGYVFQSRFNEEIQNSTVFIQESKDISQQITTSFPTWFDNGFIVAFVVFFLISLISAYLIDTSPIFLVFSIILLIGSLVVAGMVAQAAEEFIGNSVFNPYVSDLPMMVFVGQNLFPIAVVMGISILIALYAKSQRGEGF